MILSYTQFAYEREFVRASVAVSLFVDDGVQDRW